MTFRYLQCPLGFLALIIGAKIVHAIDYNITDYGAVSGGGDDLAAIHAAIADAVPGDRVLIPAGDFQISNSIVPKAGIAVVGAGRDLTKVEFMGTSPKPMIRIQSSGLDGVELTGFTLDGLGTSLATQGIEASGTKGHYIHGIRVSNLTDGSGFGPHGIYCSGSVRDSIFEDNEFVNIGVASTWGAGIRLAAGCSGNIVRGNLIDHVGRGGILLNGATDTIIRNNTVIRSGQTGPGLGIEVWGDSDRTIVEDNVIDHWLSIDRSDFVAVRRNTVIAADGSLQLIGLEMAGGTGNVFTGNMIGVGHHIGLSLSGNAEKTKTYIARNTFTDSETWGAQLQDDGGVVRQLYFYQNTFSEADSELPNLYDAPTVGIRFNAANNGAGIRQLVFDGNSITDNDQNAIALFGHLKTAGIDQLSFVNNTITNNGGSVIQNYAGMPNIEWHGNTVSGNGNNNVPSNTGFTANAKPTVQVSGPNTVGVGETAHFSMIYTDDGLDAATDVLWDLDSGLPVTAENSVMTYSSPGTHTIALVVWDEQGRAAHATHTLTVVVPTDSDGDGLYDHHEIEIHGTSPTNPDTDNDGYFDGAEVYFHTSPLSDEITPDRSVAIRKTSIAEIELTFATKLGLSYKIEKSSLLTSVSWQDVETSIPGTGQLATRQYPITETPSQVFYRMRRE
ncbi:hypothetical protein NT6N_05200 [Oceaniferula spumae]|uniref:PKD domain-containing protein n=1 Tax=Oceaniferula spumae TaxID=2979115 RepID=A0AAT9FHU1_9BACT